VTEAGLTDEQRLRYSRHLLLDEWSEEAQSRLLGTHALVLGAGGLGAPALLYLAAAGVGHITVVDPDEVELSNLQRQVLHNTASVGQPKVQSAASAVDRLNAEVWVTPIHQAADEALMRSLLNQPASPIHVVLDCTDGFAIRQLINRSCFEAGVPLVSASALRFDGQISVFDPRDASSPCYACLFPPDAPPEETRCALLGVFAPVVGTLGVMQAGEAIKLLLQSPSGGDWPGHQSLVGRLLMLDGRSWSWTSLRTRREPTCPVCSGR
jgi:molybdopterin/thiamine biosynthesis adenylyltransferase